MTLTMMPMTLDHSIALVRVVVGLLLMGHGAQKLFGWFGGHGLSGTAGWFDSLAMPMPKGLSVFVGLCELVGGLFFAFGLLTPLAALAISAVALGAIAYHWPNGLWVSQNGFEYPLVLLAVAAAVGLAGPGAYALDPIYGIYAGGLLASPTAIYVVGLVLELLGLALIQVTRGRRMVQHRHRASAA
jgi:putative oxidoreductase